MKFSTDAQRMKANVCGDLKIFTLALGRNFYPLKPKTSANLRSVTLAQILNLPFHHIPKVLYWIDLRWLWRPFESSEPNCLI